MPDIPLYIYPLLFIVAILYSSVGHGGASGYLALMGIAGISSSFSRPVALVLNCFVSIIAFIQYYRSGYFNMKLFLPLATLSVPCAYLGGLMNIDDVVYKKILGVILLFSAIRFLFPEKEKENIREPFITVLMLCGAAIGFLSGLIGIGGGIILTPLLLLLGWSNMKTAACVSAIFIFVNSLSGLVAQFQKGIAFQPSMYSMLAIAITGALAGAYYGANKWNTFLLKKILSLVLIIASLKLIFI